MHPDCPMLGKLYNFLIRPIQEPLMFIVFFILVGLIDCGYYLVNSFRYFVLLFSQAVVVSYCLSFICLMLPSKMQRCTFGLLVVLLLPFFLTDLYCLYIMKSPLNYDFQITIMGTHTDEAISFLESHFKVSFLILSIVGIALIVVLVRCVYKSEFRIKGKPWQIVLLLSIICVLLLSLRVPSIYMDGIIGKVSFPIMAERNPDLRDHLSNPKLLGTSRKPHTIVLIIGESFAKSHSSFSGYPKQTNPRLQKLCEDSLLFYFDSVESAAVMTVNSFKAIMNTYRHSYKDSIKWYDCTTLCEVANLENYRTEWLSNQKHYGWNDNIPGSFSELCDTAVFIMDNCENEVSYDESLVDLAKRIIPNDKSDKFVFFHLIGEHIAFCDRYPQSHKLYKEDDYPNLLSNQKNVIADYDNAVLYNDYVVSRIIDLFKNEESVILYVPDHGLDLFDSADDFYGHPKPTDAVSMYAARQIPFMIYCSPTFQKNYPDIMKRIKANLHSKFNTEDLIYTIMDIMGVRFADNDDVAKYSLLRQAGR